MTGRLLLLLALLLSGCASTEITNLRNDLAQQMPEATITEGRSFSFGPVSIGLARLITRVAGKDAVPARVVLRDIHRVKFGRYAVEGSVDASRAAMPERLRRYVDRRGWTPLLTVRDESEAVWILYRERRGRITDMFVAVLSDQELVLGRVSGNLSRAALGILDYADVQLPFLLDDSTASGTTGDEPVANAPAP